MKKPAWLAILPLVTGALVAAAPRTAAAHDVPARGVGLGVTAGVAIPNGGNPLSGFDKHDPQFNWGFYTDIPLIDTFHITPSALVYKLGKADAGNTRSATDISLTFKFIIPLPLLALYIGATGGLTATQVEDSSFLPHVGLTGGFHYNLVSNLYVTAGVSYKLLIQDKGNIKDLQLYAGPLFRF